MSKKLILCTIVLIFCLTGGTQAANIILISDSDEPGGTGDYHLAVGSAAIDASDPDTATAADIEGTAAVGVRDVGAYEFVAP